MKKKTLAWGLENIKTGKLYPEAFVYKKYVPLYEEDRGYKIVRVEIRIIKP